MALFKVPGCHVRRLQAKDTSILQVLLEKCSDYSRLASGQPPAASAAASLLVNLPEGKTLADKLAIGIFTPGRDLIGVLDAVCSYPGPDDWWLGLLLLDPAHRSQGLGGRIYPSFERWAGRRGARRIYLYVLEQNLRAFNFWQGMGFERIERQPERRFGEADHVMITMRREVGAGMFPTSDPEINTLLQALQSGIQSLLGDQLLGLYLEGSLAAGGFDAASDIDFVAVTQEEVTPEQFTALQALHDRLQALDTPWAIQLEGMYLSRAALRRHDPAHAVFPNLERGPGERLKMVRYDESGVIHRWILRQYGIVLLGLPPHELIDPVSSDDLRQAVRALLPGWGGGLLEDPSYLQQAGYQSYVVLSMCRILYTIQHGAIVSKLTAAEWAKDALPERWRPLIERAWVTRSAAHGQPSPEEISATLGFVRYTLQQIGNDQ